MTRPIIEAPEGALNPAADLAPGEMEALAVKIGRLRSNVETVFLGKPEVVRWALVALFANGHVLIEDAPGVGKTTLARTLASSLNLAFKRIQFTPDLLPSDILGVSVYHEAQDAFVFKPGPIFANIVLADEINRATPRTQSSLLEAMNDYQVSVDGLIHPLEAPFVVIATQNPFEYEGTYPLPESQLDRFFMKIRVGYPDREDEKRILRMQKYEHPLNRLGAVLTREEVLRIQAAVKRVAVDEALLDYLLQVTGRTRDLAGVRIGVSPRGSHALYRAAQALALVEGRTYCVPDDFKRLAVPVLAHRILLNGVMEEGAGASPEELVAKILKETRVPL